MLYDQSNGEGVWSGLGISFFTLLLYFFGPGIASYIPRCMAGTLLLHIGIDLVLEGVYDCEFSSSLNFLYIIYFKLLFLLTVIFYIFSAYGKFDSLEYTGIWAITLMMSIYGMSAALVAGIISALSVYAVQSITHQNPVRGAMSAKTLRSSRLNRPPGAKAILDSDDMGRRKIFVIQLQGHVSYFILFFGTQHITFLFPVQKTCFSYFSISPICFYG